MSIDPTPFKNVPVHQMPSLIGIYEVIDVIQTKLSDQFSWLDKSFGRAVKAGRIDEETGRKTYPVVFVTGKDPANAMDNDNPKAYSFMYARDPETLADGEEYLPHEENIYTRVLDLIIIFNQTHIDSSVTYPMNEEVKNDIRLALGNLSFSCGDYSIDILNIYDEPDDIFEGFEYDFVESQKFVHPWYGLRFELQAYFKNNLSAYSTPVNTAISSMTLSSNSITTDADSAVSDITVTMSPLANNYYFLFNPLDSNPDWLDITDNNDGTATISDNGGTRTNGSYNVIVIALVNSTIVGASILAVTVSAPTPITALTYSNNNQQIWEDGQFVTMSPTPTPSAATGTYSIVEGAVSGVSIDSSTGAITVTFASLASGATNFTARITGSGSYSGTADFSVTITKREKWTPADLGTDCVFLGNTNDASNRVMNADGYHLERLNDGGGSDIYLEVAGSADLENFPVQTLWPYDEDVIAFLADNNTYLTFNGASDLSEDYRIFYIGFQGTRDGKSMIGDNTLNGERWGFLGLGGSFRNYPNNQSLTSDQWKAAFDGAGVYMFDPYDETDEDAVTYKNDGSKYRLVHTLSNTTHQDSLPMTTLKVLASECVYVGFLVVKGTGCLQANINKILGWALHEFSLPSSQFDSEFEYIETPPLKDLP